MVNSIGTVYEYIDAVVIPHAYNYYEHMPSDLDFQQHNDIVGTSNINSYVLGGKK